MKQYQAWAPPVFDGEPRLAVITPMLANVLESLCEGKTNRAIGRDWGITEDTVKTHVRRLYARLGARDRCHAVTLVLSGQVRVIIAHARGYDSAEPSLDATLSTAGSYPPRL